MGKLNFGHSTGLMADSIRRKSSKTERNLPRQVLNYKEYKLSWDEWMMYGGMGVAAAAATAYCFYRSWIAFLILLPAGLACPLYQKKTLKEKRLQELKHQFKDGILSLAASLSAGYSVENSMVGSLREMKLLYGEQSMIVSELDYMVGRIRRNETAEEAWEDFGIRSGLDDIRNFAEVFAIARRSGGELVHIINHAAEVIREKTQVQEEIVTLTSARQYEQKVMNLIPFFILFYIDAASPGFFTLMYETMLGRIVMTSCLAVYVAAIILAARILEIEI